MTGGTDSNVEAPRGRNNKGMDLAKGASQVKKTLALAACLLLAFPTVAYAEAVVAVTKAVSIATGVCSLLLSAMLLVVVVQLRRVADGSAIVAHIAYVVSASLCLVAAILVGWVDRFTSGFSTDTIRAGGDVLVMFALLLFAVYFTRVKRALSAFLAHLETADMLAAVNGAEVEEDGVA